MSVVAPDLRGKIYRERRLMQPAETTEFLRRQKVANVGTVDVNGWPYVVPLVYIYEAATCFTFTPAITKATSSQMCRTIRGYALRSQKSGTCIAASPTPVTRLWCTRASLYLVRSAFCTVQNPVKKKWFLDQLLAKYGRPEWTFEPGYPLIDRIILYEQKIEVVTGKHSSGLYH